jgi:hypothetical protein
MPAIAITRKFGVVTAALIAAIVVAIVTLTCYSAGVCAAHGAAQASVTTSVTGPGHSQNLTYPPLG